MFFMLNGQAHATPQLVRVDGSIYDASGNPFTGSRDIQIKAYDAAIGGSLLWTSQVYDASVASGRFTINLDTSDTSVSSPSLVIQMSKASSGSALWFEIHYDVGTSGNSTMDSDQVVRPRIRARGTMFAAAAATADAIRGIAVSTAIPNPAYLLSYDGTQWAPTSLPSIAGATYVAKVGDSMSGSLNVGAGVNARGLTILNQATQGQLTLGDTATHYIALQSPDVLAANLTLTLPSGNGTSGQALTTDGSGNLSWSSPNASDASKVAKTGDSMSGSLNVGAAISTATTLNAATVNVANLNANQLVVTDGAKNLVSESRGNISGLGAVFVTGGTNAAVGGAVAIAVQTASASTNGILTMNDWVAFNDKQANLGYTPVSRSGDTMTGGLGLNYSDANTSTALILDSARKVVSSAVTSTELGYLAGVSANVQTQINALGSSSSAPRVVSVADSTTFTPTGNTADENYQINTQVSGTLTMAAPTGTPVSGQKIILRVKSTNIQTFSWNAVYRGSADLPLPVSSTGSSKTDYVGLIYNAEDSKWDLVAAIFGF